MVSNAAAGTWLSAETNPPGKQWRPVTGVVAGQPSGLAGLLCGPEPRPLLLPTPAAAGDTWGCRGVPGQEVWAPGGPGRWRPTPGLQVPGGSAVSPRFSCSGVSGCAGDKASRAPDFQGLLAAGPSSFGLSSLVFSELLRAGPFRGPEAQPGPLGPPSVALCLHGRPQNRPGTGSSSWTPGGPRNP